MRSRLEPSIGLGVLLAGMFAASAASGAERTLVLELVINGRPTGRVGEFSDREGVLYARPSELRELGFILPPGVGADGGPIPLTSLTKVRATVNAAQQTLIVVADNSALAPTELHAAAAPPLAPLAPPGFGALINYDAVATFAGGRPTGGAFLDGRAFSPYGLVQSTGFFNIAPNAGGRRFTRLDSTYAISQPDQLRQWRVGDVVSGALPWTRAVRLGGVQVASDFGLRPDLVTYPLPQIGASVAVPSTVNVLVNGVRQLSEAVQPGPFSVHTLPVVTGAGEIAVSVVDVLGQQTLVTLPFYASTALLSPGLGSYSLEFGSVRRNYGEADDRYAGWAASGSARYGLTDWLTLEAHDEVTDGLELVGGGVTSLIGKLGVANVAIAGSSSAAGPAGAMLWASFQRMSGRASFSVSGGLSSSGYRDIAADYGSAPPKATLGVNLGYQLGRWGIIGLAYNSQSSRPQSAPLPRAPDSNIVNPPVELFSASYSVSIGRASFYATGFQSVLERHGVGVGIGVSVALGGTAYGSLDTSLAAGHFTSSANVTKSALTTNDYGYRLQASAGDGAHLMAEGEYLNSWGHVAAGVDESAGRVAGRASVSGALVLDGGQLFASDKIVDSFAVVSTGGVAGVPVLYENRPVGETDSHGKLLVPWLLSYQNNLLALDATRLPADVEVGETALLVRPGAGAGAKADFHVRKVHAALLTVRDRAGRPIPLGSVAKGVNGADDAPVGYDGAAYVTGLKPANRITVLLPDGSKCGVAFAYKPVIGEIPLIGPLVCQ